MEGSGWWQQKPKWSKPSKEGFPHFALRAFGLVLVLLGIVLMAFGIASWLYTELFYGIWCYADVFCNYKEIIYPRVGSAAWGGLLVLITGAIALSLRNRSPSALKSRRDAFAGLAALCTIAVLPCVLALNILELWTSKGLFFDVSPSGSLVMADPWKFVFPVIILGTGFITWVMCLAALIMICVRGAINDPHNTKYASFHDDMRDPRRPQVPMPGPMGPPPPGPMGDPMGGSAPTVHHHYYASPEPAMDNFGYPAPADPGFASPYAF